VRPMKKLLIPFLSASLAVSALPVAPASATPLLKPGLSVEKNITLVGHRGRGWRGRRHHGHGAGAAGIIGAIIAGTLIAAAIREGRAHKSDLRACDEDFPDFDYETGTYIDRDGDERVCPYLR